jgi:hypothetical protein
MRTRLATRDEGGVTWSRLRVPLVDGEPVTPLVRLATICDFASGTGNPIDFTRFTSINPDLSLHVLREPRGEWIGITARTSIEPDGIGQSSATLFDEEGAVARALVSLLVERGAPSCRAGPNARGAPYTANERASASSSGGSSGSAHTKVTRSSAAHHARAVVRDHRHLTRTRHALLVVAHDLERTLDHHHDRRAEHRVLGEPGALGRHLEQRPQRLAAEQHSPLRPFARYSGSSRSLPASWVSENRWNHSGSSRLSRSARSCRDRPRARGGRGEGARRACGGGSVRASSRQRRALVRRR